VKKLAFTRLAQWYNKIKLSKIDSFETVARSIQANYLSILNFFDNRSKMLLRSRSMLKSKLFVQHSEVCVILISFFLDLLKFMPKTSNPQYFVLIQIRLDPQYSSRFRHYKKKSLTNISCK